MFKGVVWVHCMYIMITIIGREGGVEGGPDWQQTVEGEPQIGRNICKKDAARVYACCTTGHPRNVKVIGKWSTRKCELDACISVHSNSHGGNTIHYSQVWCKHLCMYVNMQLITYVYWYCLHNCILTEFQESESSQLTFIAYVISCIFNIQTRRSSLIK